MATKEEPHEKAKFTYYSSRKIIALKNYGIYSPSHTNPFTMSEMA